MRTLAAQGWLTWCSYEPALGPIDFSRALVPRSVRDGFAEVQRRYPCDPATIPAHLRLRPSLDWVVIGGESGPGARPFDLAWARQAIAQCKAAGVPVFVKQMGAKPVRRYLDMTHSEGPDVEEPIPLRDRKGGDMAEWAEDLRVREYPR